VQYLLAEPFHWTHQRQLEYDLSRTRRLRSSAANIGPNRFHQKRTISWQMSMPRSWRKSSTCCSESGNRTYIITAKRMISGDVLKYRNGFLIRECYETAISGSSEFLLTLPQFPGQRCGNRARIYRAARAAPRLINSGIMSSSAPNRTRSRRPNTMVPIALSEGRCSAIMTL
jgi:hypothetical protein